MHHRRLTVSRIFQPRSQGRLKPAPFLRLTGQWLAAAGFPIGERVEVRVESGRLILEPLEMAGDAEREG